MTLGYVGRRIPEDGRSKRGAPGGERVTVKKGKRVLVKPWTIPLRESEEEDTAMSE